MPTESLVFDIGATWFRSAIGMRDGSLSARRAVPAVSFLSHPACSARELQGLLIDHLAEEAASLRRAAPHAMDAIVSLGAALNGHTGFVYDSGPLWGPRCEPFDLLAALRERAPELRWRVVNDVTAALLRHVATLPPRANGRTALVTVSSGIAARVYDHARRGVPLDPVHGIQGEIGHLPVSFAFAGRALARRCNCGGERHLNAYTSGRGIAAVLGEVAAWPDGGFAGSLLARRCAGAAPTNTDWAAAVLAGCPWSRALLDAVLEPLAAILAVVFAHDPELDPILFCGGVATGLGATFVTALGDRLAAIGLYQLSDRDPDWFRRRLKLGSDDDDSGLIGCALAATFAPEVLR